MQQPQHDGAVLQTATEDVGHGDVNSDTQADEEKGRHDDAKGGGNDERDVGACHEHLADAEEPCTAQPRTKRVEEDGGEDEAQSLADENERYNGVSDFIVSTYDILLALGFLFPYFYRDG